MVDGAAVNSLVFQYLEVVHPERTSNIKIIERSEWFAMPPVVVAKGIDPDLIKKIKEIFFTLHTDSASKKVLDKLMFDRFVLGNDSMYNSVRKLIL